MRPQTRSSGTISALVLFGVPVRFHFTFLLLLIFLATAVLSWRWSIAMDAAFIAALFLSVLLHELGHALAARAYGIRTLEIVMYPIGGVARLERQATPKAELFIALAGPLVNVLIAAALFGGLAAMAEPRVRELVARIATGNIYLAAFNMAPAFPMDGGRVLRALLALWKGEAVATRVAATAGRTLAMLMGIYGLVTGQILLLLIAFLVYAAATQEGAISAGRALTHGIPVRDAMVTEYHTLPHGSTIREASQRLIATSQQDFPVMHGDRVIGLLDRTAFVRGMAVEGAETYISQVMDRDFVRLDPEMDLAEALPLLSAGNPCALVMDGERLAGLLTRENISEFLLMRRFGVAPPKAAR